MSRREQYKAVIFAGLMILSAVTGSVAFTGVVSANGSSDQDVSISVADQQVGAGETTIYTVQIQNNGPEETTYTVEPTRSPSDWNVDDQESFDINNYKQITLGGYDSGSVKFAVTAGSQSKSGQVTFGVWHATSGFLGSPKDHKVDSASSGHTVDANGPTFSDIQTSYDGTEVTVEADVTDLVGVDTVNLNYDTGNFLGGGNSVPLTQQSGNTYEGTFDVGWNQEFSYEVEATDQLGNTKTSSTQNGQTPANTPPDLTVDSVQVNDDRTVTIEATASDNTDWLDSVRVEWGGYLGGSAEMSSQGGDQYAVTVPKSGSFDWGQEVTLDVIAEDNYGQSTSASETVQLPANQPPQLGDLNVVANDDRTVTVEVTATDDTNEIDRVELTWDRGALDIGGTTVEMARVGTDRYRATIPQSDQLEWGESVQIKATAFDNTGQSTASNTETVSAVDDTTAPQISDTQIRYDGKDVIIEGEVADGTSGVDTATVTYETGGLFGSGEAVMNRVSGDTFQATFTVDYGTDFTADISATDGAGNTRTANEMSGEVPRGAAVLEVTNNDDESKTVAYSIDGDERGTLTVAPDNTVSKSVVVDPTQQTVEIEYTDADRDGQTFTEQTSVTIPQAGSETAQLTVQERLSPILEVDCTECSLGTFNRSDPPSVTIDVNNVGGGDLEWTYGSTPLNVTDKTENKLVVTPDLSTGEFSREVDILVLNDQTDGPTRRTVTLTGTATVEPEPPSVSLVSYPSLLRLGDQPTSRVYGEAGAPGTSDQPDPAAAEDLNYRWLLNGTEIAQTTGEPADGPGAAAETTLDFDEPGTYTLQVEAVDPQTGLTDQTDPVLIEVGEVSGQITGYEAPVTETYTRDRWYTVTLTVANTGDLRHTFEVTADQRSGMEIKNKTQSITLAAGESGTVSFEQRWTGNYIDTVPFSHELRIDTASDRTPSVVDETTLRLSAPANGKATFRPTTADGEPVDVDVTVSNASTGEIVTETTVAEQSLGVTSKTHAFEAGTYEATFEADGYRSRTRSLTITDEQTLLVEPTLAPDDVNASLNADSFTVEAGNYSVGDFVNGSVQVRNTGDQPYEFFVGYSVRSNQTGVVRSGSGQTGQFVALDPGEETTVDLSWRVDETAAAGEYAAIAAVWYGYPERGASQIESTGWVPDSFVVTSDAQTESITYQNRSYIIETNPDNTIAVYDSSRKLVDAETARAVLQYRAFLRHSTDNPSEGWIGITERSTNLEKYYWLANLNEAGITGFQAYVRAHFGSYQDATGEFIDLGLQGTRIVDEQQNTDYSASVRDYAERAKTSHELYTGAKDVRTYTEIVSDAYKIKKAQQGLSMVDAIQEVETADDGSIDPDVKGLARGAALDILFAPMNDASAGLRITQQQALLISTYGKMGRAQLEMLRDLEEKRQAGTITPREMELYHILQAEFFKSTVQAFHQIAELDELGQEQSSTYSLATALNGEQLSESSRASAESIVPLINIKYEQLAKYNSRVDNVSANTINIHGQAANTSSLAAPDPLLVTSPVWVEPGDEFTIGVESRGKAVIDAQVSIGDQVATTDRNGEASFTFFERGSYNISVTKDGFEAGSSVVQVREPKTIPRTFDDITVGEVDAGQELTRETTLENTGERTLNLTGVTVASKAIEVTAPRGSIEPGESATVTVIIDTSELSTGFFAEPVTVEWADTDESSRFTISGNIVKTTGTLSVESVPSDATVIIDGTTQGTTPLTLDLAAGDHTVVVERDGYEDTSQTVAIATNKTTATTVSLSGQPDLDITTADGAVTNGSGTATFTVTNDGTGAASAVSIDLTTVPDNWNVTNIEADEARWDGSQWTLEKLEAGDQIRVSATVTPPVWAGPGDYTVGAAVRGEETTSQLTHDGGSPPSLDPRVNNSRITAGENVSLSAASPAEVKSQTSYTWALVDGNATAVSNLPAGPQGTVQVADPDRYTFQVTATNGSWTTTENVTVIAEEDDDTPPVADAGGPYSAAEGDTIDLETSGSTAPDGEIVQTEWDIIEGPGSITNGSYQAPDGISQKITATVQLTVTASNNQSDTDTSTISVQDDSTPDDPSTNPVLSSLSIAGNGTTATITEGDDEPVDLRIENTGDTQETFTIEATLGDQTATNTVTVDAGAVEQTSFTDITTALDPGTYTVTVQPKAGTATVTGELTVTEAAQPPAEGIQHADGIAGTTYTVNEPYSAEVLIAAPATNETLTLGGETGRTIEIRHPATDRRLEVSPESETALSSTSFALELYHANGTLKPDPAIDPRDGQPVPVEVTGDETIFTDFEGPFTRFSMALLEDGTVVDTTDSRRIGIGYPSSFEQTGTQGSITVTLPRDANVNADWTAEFDLGATADGGPLVTSPVENTNGDNSFEVTVDVSDVESGVYNGRLTLTNDTAATAGVGRVISIVGYESIVIGEPDDVAPETDITADTAGNTESPIRIDVFVEGRIPESAGLTISDPDGRVVFTENVTERFQDLRAVSRKIEWDPVDQDGNALADGEYTAVFTVEDKFGHEVATNETITVDNSPPAVDNVGVVSGPVTNTTEDIVIGANITSTPSNLSTVELGVDALFTAYSNTTRFHDSDLDQVRDGNRIETAIDPATLAGDIGDGNFTVTAVATDAAGNTEVVVNDTVTVDTSVADAQARVTGLGTTQAALQVTADENVSVTNVEITAKAADGTTEDRTPDSRQTPTDTATAFAIPFDAATVGEQDTTFTATVKLKDAAGNTETATVNASVTGYELTNGEAEVDPNGTDAAFTLSATSATANGTRSATVGQTAMPPTGTALDANQSASMFIDVTDIGLTEAELQNATVRIPVERIDMDGVSPEELVYFYSPDGSEEYQVREPEVDDGDLVVEVDGFSQLAPGRVDEQPPTVSITTTETQATETLKISYDDELSAVDVSSVDVSVNGNTVTAADGLQVTASNATYPLPDAAEYTVSVDVADEAGNTAQKTRTLQDGQTRPTVTELSGLDGTTIADDTDTVELQYESASDTLDTEDTTLRITVDGATSTVSPVVDNGQISYELDVTEGTNYTAELTVANGAGKTSTTTEFSVARGAAAGGGDEQAGGGGGGMPNNEESTTQTELFEFEGETTVRVSEVPRSGAADIETAGAVTGGPFDLTGVRMQFRFDVPDFRIEITDPRAEAGQAPRLPDAAGTPVGFLEVDAIGANQATVDRTTATLAVDEGAIPDGGATADLTAYQYVDGEWRSLATDTSGGTLTATLATHEAKHIALAVDSETDTNPDTSTDDDADATNATDSSGDTDSDENESTAPPSDQPADGESGDEIPGFGALTAIGALVTLLLYSRVRHRQ